MAGIFFPSPEGSLPIDMKAELFRQLSTEVGRQLKRSGSSEQEILGDFETWRKSRRGTRRRR
jgi:hypothetical protein